MLHEIGFDPTSALWRELARRLVEYGYPVLVGWAVRGTLAAKVARYGGLGRGKVPRGLLLDRDDAQQLAADVITVSVERFRTRSLPSWDPGKGAALRTFFIRRCLLDLPEAYQKWARLRHDGIVTDFNWVDDGRHGPRPDEQVEARVMVDQILDRDPVVRQILELQAAGYTLGEIAERLAISPSAARTRTFRLRQRIVKEGFDV